MPSALCLTPAPFSGTVRACPRPSGLTLDWAIRFVKTSPIAGTIRDVSEGLPKNVFGICYADQWTSHVKDCTRLAVAIMTERNDVPLVGGVIHQLNMGTVCGFGREIRTICSVAVACWKTSSLFPIPNPVTGSAPFL